MSARFSQPAVAVHLMVLLVGFVVRRLVRRRLEGLACLRRSHHVDTLPLSGGEMERTRVWHGHVKPEHHDEHEQFVAWLNTDEARLQYSKFLLNGYTLAQQGDDLTVTLAAEEPPAIIRFLRNPRMWPEFWEYDSAGGDAELPEDSIRVRWRRG